MSTTEEKTESIVKKDSFVDEFLESGRKKAKSSLSTQDNPHIKDLEYMLRSVKALVKIINEIWDNCEKHLTSGKDNNSPFTFKRRVCKEVIVKKKGRNMTITTKIESNRKDFGSPPDVSEDLSKLVCFDPPEEESESVIFPDYNRYLEKSTILCKELLLPFLIGFKESLENVQVYLGQIEAWLLEPEANNSYLKETFDGPGCVKCESKNDPSKIFLYRSYCLDVDSSRMESKFDICTEKGRDRLKATIKYIKIYQPVTQIEVKDAGEEAVNGTYTLKGMNNGVYKYTRSDIWDGKPVTFYLARQQTKKKKWCIYCKCKNETDSLVTFYWTEGTGEEYELPPLYGWRIGKHGDNAGVDPPPLIHYKVDD